MAVRILIIDDEASVRDAFELALEPLGYTVECVADGLAGIEAARLCRPDLVFLDLKMPGIDGVETLRRLNAVDAAIPVHIVTAFSREYLEPLRRARAEHLSFEIASKPLSAEQIRQIAQSVVGAPS